MLRNNADAGRCSYFELGLPVCKLLKGNSHPSTVYHITRMSHSPFLLSSFEEIHWSQWYLRNKKEIQLNTRHSFVKVFTSPDKFHMIYNMHTKYLSLHTDMQTAIANNVQFNCIMKNTEQKIFLFIICSKIASGLFLSWLTVHVW